MSVAAMFLVDGRHVSVLSIPAAAECVSEFLGYDVSPFTIRAIVRDLDLGCPVGNSIALDADDIEAILDELDDDLDAAEDSDDAAEPDDGLNDETTEDDEAADYEGRDED